MRAYLHARALQQPAVTVWHSPPSHPHLDWLDVASFGQWAFPKHEIAELPDIYVWRNDQDVLRIHQSFFSAVSDSLRASSFLSMVTLGEKGSDRLLRVNVAAVEPTSAHAK